MGIDLEVQLPLCLDVCELPDSFPQGAAQVYIPPGSEDSSFSPPSATLVII